MDPEKKLQTIFKEANQHVSLRADEKEAIRSQIKAFMNANPASVLPAKPAQAVFLSWSTILRTPVAHYGALTALVLAVFTGGTISFAAQNALPGDYLYPIKVGVNEKVLSFIAFSDEQRAEYGIHLTQTRLEEMEKVVAMNGENDATSTQVKNLLDGHIANVTSQAQRIAQKQQPEVSAKIHSELEASLQAHEKVLDVLSLIPGKQANRKKAVDTFVSGVKANTKKATEARKQDEKELSNKALAAANAMKVSAQTRMQAAKKAVAEFSVLFNNTESSNNSANVRAQVNVAIEQANALILHGEGKINSDDFAGAFANFQEAIRVVQETSIHVKASTNFNITVPAQPKNSINNVLN